MVGFKKSFSNRRETYQTENNAGKHLGLPAQDNDKKLSQENKKQGLQLLEYQTDISSFWLTKNYGNLQSENMTIICLQWSQENLNNIHITLLLP